jgi:hypothetical protein
MRFTVAFGALTMAMSLFAACGDDEGDPNGAAGAGAGTGGAAGSSGSDGVGGTTYGPGAGGQAGVSGCGNVGVSPVCSISSGGTAGTAGAPSDPSDAGLSDAASDASNEPPEPCTGCLELRATVTNSDDSAFFQIVYDTPVDMSDAGATVTFHVSGLAPEDQVRVAPFLYDADYTFAPGDDTELTAADGFLDLVLDLDDITDVAFDKTSVLYVGLLVGYTGGIGAESSQALALLLDAVTFSAPSTPDLAFTTDSEGFNRSDDIGVSATEVVHR